MEFSSNNPLAEIVSLLHGIALLLKPLQAEEDHARQPNECRVNQYGAVYRVRLNVAPEPMLFVQRRRWNEAPC